MNLWIRVLNVVLLSLSAPLHGDWIEPPVRTESGYPVPQPDVLPELPRAHGAHPGYGIEWWYWVGHLRDAEGVQRYGFQVTVFRVEGAAETAMVTDAAAFGSQQLFMAHVALSDLNTGQYLHTERVYRHGWQARASVDSLDLAVGPVRATQDPKTERIDIEAALPDGQQLSLRMEPSKALLAFGDRGLSRKGAAPAAVSWYWTYSRLKVQAELVRDGATIELDGQAWMDHEISSSQLGDDLAGWDWTAIQLDDGSEVKAYRLRDQKGRADRWSAVYWIDPEGRVQSVYAEGFSWEEDGYWQSPESGNRYPTEVTIRAQHPSNGKVMVYRLRPLMQQQEFLGMRADNAYWEGACEVLDVRGQRIGLAYLELAGYGGGLAGQLTQ
ncbi:lipocalin-like domain-containing protein [Coraliomargarita akajimensis]|uniref:AttH domain-containing protein n=1 Tax=Coraliomargarita akajimensis (strain DSM 45221 / IAM 15411 / JCM 23193 / KCTC 12865 / 04OKA010-24) TaxID=583355 RepID=D5EPW0_CORAD|nr:lipocalin-like domain-containing protein [Coraliomargarita akajimensis]ADE55693.1 Protein of unknown function DUF2006 [Coraliomargarita akajimensis DSM 45221]